MDPVRGAHDISRSPGAVRKGDDCLVNTLLESDAPMVCLHHTPGQSGYEYLEQIGAVHAVELDPASGLSRPHRRNQRAVRMAELRVKPIQSLGSADPDNPKLDTGNAIDTMPAVPRTPRPKPSSHTQS